MFLDIGMGILISIFTTWLFDVPLDPLYAWGGIFFSLLPDLDAVLHFLKGKEHRHESFRHRELFHQPLLYFAVGTVALFQYPVVLTIFLLCSLSHFLHDSVGVGWGVQWLRPFSKDRFEFLYSYRPPHLPRAPRQWTYRWPHEDIEELAKTHGDPEWIKNIYLKFHPFAVAELLVFLIALMALYLYLN